MGDIHYIVAWEDRRTYPTCLRLRESTYRRLKKLRRELNTTYDKLISMLLDLYEEKRKARLYTAV